MSNKVRSDLFKIVIDYSKSRAGNHVPLFIETIANCLLHFIDDDHFIAKNLNLMELNLSLSSVDIAAALEAVLIKNYASLDKWKKFLVFFLKIATYQSTPKILYVLKGTKEETKGNQRGTKELKRNWRENQNFPPLPILPNSLFIKIDPCGV